MPGLSALSLARLSTCHADLQRLVKAVASHAEILVVCGHRNQKEQNEAYAKGRSKLYWPKSKHNPYPSRAVDIAPWPLDWEDTEAFETLSALVKKKAIDMGIIVIWGGDWKMRDLVHWELGGYDGSAAA